jgi:hypothetical protein
MGTETPEIDQTAAMLAEETHAAGVHQIASQGGGATQWHEGRPMQLQRRPAAARFSNAGRALDDKKPN